MSPASPGAGTPTSLPSDVPSHRNELLVVALLLAVVGAAAIALLGSDDGTEGMPAPDPSLDMAQDEPDEPAAVRTTEIETPVATRVAGQRDTERSDRPLGAPPTHGYLDVRIQPTAGIVGKFRSGTLFVTEAISENAGPVDPGRRPFHNGYPVKPGPQESPIYVGVPGIPFSEYGYRVTLFAPGFNGSSQVVRVAEDSWNPQVELTVVPPAPLALRLVDQRYEPWLDTAITLVPVDEPLGRPIQQATTDNFGTAVFETVLAGDYEVRFGADQVQSITVDRPGFVFDDLEVGVQSKHLIVPRGRSLKVEVFDTFGHAIEGVDVVTFVIDTVENRRYTDQTDRSGIVDFEHVVPGTYQIDVSAPGFQRTSKNRFIVRPDVDPDPVRFRLIRLR